MADQQAPPLTVVEPGQGRKGDLGSIGVVFKLFGKDTGGQLQAIGAPLPRGGLGATARPHERRRVLDRDRGRDRLSLGGQGSRLGAGGYITKPRNELHSMWNAGASPARMIEIISPAGFEGFFWELADLLTAGPPRQSQVGQVADKYGLLFQDAPWLADVVERHHLASGQAGVPA